MTTDLGIFFLLLFLGCLCYQGFYTRKDFFRDKKRWDEMNSRTDEIRRARNAGEITTSEWEKLHTEIFYTDQMFFKDMVDMRFWKRLRAWEQDNL